MRNAIIACSALFILFSSLVQGQTPIESTSSISGQTTILYGNVHVEFSCNLTMRCPSGDQEVSIPKESLSTTYAKNPNTDMLCGTIVAAEAKKCQGGSVPSYVSTTCNVSITGPNNIAAQSSFECMFKNTMYSNGIRGEN